MSCARQLCILAVTALVSAASLGQDSSDLSPEHPHFIKVSYENVSLTRPDGTLGSTVTNMPWTKPLSLLQTLGRMRLGPFMHLEFAYVIRDGKTYEFVLDELRRGRRSDPPLQPGDTVEVRVTRIVSPDIITGETNKITQNNPAHATGEPAPGR